MDRSPVTGGSGKRFFFLFVHAICSAAFVFAPGGSGNDTQGHFFPPDSYTFNFFTLFSYTFNPGDYAENEKALVFTPRSPRAFAFSSLFLSDQTDLQPENHFMNAQFTAAEGNAGIYQAETAVLGGGAGPNNNHTGYTGMGFVDGYWKQGAATTFYVVVSYGGYYDVTLRYANGFRESGISLYVSGKKMLFTVLPSTGSWSLWAHKTETLYLNPGVNPISYIYDPGDPAHVNLDRIEVIPTKVQKPDLIVSDIQWIPIDPSEGQAVLFRAVVQNNGTAPSPSANHRVVFKVDDRELMVSGAYTSSIPIGRTGLITAAVTWTAQTGEHIVSAGIDPENTIPEFNDSNNTNARILIVMP